MHLMLKKFSALALLAVAGSACSAPLGLIEDSSESSPAPEASTQAPSQAPQVLNIKLTVELWDKSTFRKIDGDACAVRKSQTNLRGDLGRNKNVVLVGPDDVELASASFNRGLLSSTRAMDDGTFANFPTEPICVFDATFEDVEEVATYRVKFRKTGIDGLSFDLEEVRMDGDQMSMVFGAQPRD